MFSVLNHSFSQNDWVVLLAYCTQNLCVQNLNCKMVVRFIFMGFHALEWCIVWKHRLRVTPDINPTFRSVQDFQKINKFNSSFFHESWPIFSHDNSTFNCEIIFFCCFTGTQMHSRWHAGAVPTTAVSQLQGLWGYCVCVAFPIFSCVCVGFLWVLRPNCILYMSVWMCVCSEMMPWDGLVSHWGYSRLPSSVPIGYAPNAPRAWAG